MRKFKIKNPSGQQIVGLIHKPETKPPFPTLVICHGFKGYKEKPDIDFISKYLLENGICVIAFDFTNGIGESDGDILNISARHYQKDTEAILKFALEQNFVDKNDLHLLGISYGGTVTIMFTASKKPKIKSLIFQAPALKLEKTGSGINPKEWRKRGYWRFYSRSKDKWYKVGYQYYLERKQLKIFPLAEKICVPALIIQGSKDNDLSSSHNLKLAKSFLEKIKSKTELKIIKNAGHVFESKEHLQEYAETVLDWINSC